MLGDGAGSRGTKGWVLAGWGWLLSLGCRSGCFPLAPRGPGPIGKWHPYWSPKGQQGCLGSRGFLTLDWAPSAGGDVTLESDAAYSHQRGPYLWCGTADGIKQLVLHSGSGNGVSQCLSMYCKSVVSETKSDRGTWCHWNCWWGERVAESQACDRAHQRFRHSLQQLPALAAAGCLFSVIAALTLWQYSASGCEEGGEAKRDVMLLLLRNFWWRVLSDCQMFELISNKCKYKSFYS